MLITKEKLLTNSKKLLLYYLKDIMFLYTFVIIFLKSLILLGFVHNTDNSMFDLSRSLDFEPSLVVYGCFILILLSFSFLFKGRLHLWYLIFINLFISFFILMDLWNFRGFGSFATLHMLKQTANLENLSDSVISMMRPIDIVFIFDILILIIIVSFNKNPYKKMNRSVLSFVVLLALSVAYIQYYHYKVDILEEGENNILFRICWTPKQTIANLSPIGYHIYDAYTYWDECQELKLKPSEKTEIQKWYDDKKESLPDNKYKGIYRGKNLIFLQVESLENFVINKKVNGQEITPNLNKLLENSLYFSEFYEQVNNGTSSDADLMANTSIYPVRRGSTFYRYPYNTYNSMPKMMEKLGYKTLAAHPDRGSMWNWMEALNSMGFQKCIDSTFFNHDEFIGLGISDGTYLKQLYPVIKELKQPFYTFMVTLTSHGPFNIPDKYRELRLDEKLNQSKLGGYFQSIHYTDKHIGMFINRLKEDRLLDNSVIVIYGDHTGVHKYYQDELKKMENAESWWFDGEKHIPLIIYQNQSQGEELKTKGGHIDILPTAAYLMGIDSKEYENSAMGRNLLNTSRNFAVLSDGGYVGDMSNSKVKEHALKGIDIADMIIRSNYFGTK